MSGIKRERIAEYRSATYEAKPALPVELLSSRDWDRQSSRTAECYHYASGNQNN